MTTIEQKKKINKKKSSKNRKQTKNNKKYELDVAFVNDRVATDHGHTFLDRSTVGGVYVMTRRY